MISKSLTETRGAALAALLSSLVAFAGCSSSDASKQAQGNSAGSAASAAAAPSDTAAPSEAAAQPASDDAAFPVYPNAKSQPIPKGMGQIEMCGHKQTITQYAVDADGKAVVDWYKSHLPNAVAEDIAAATADEGDASSAIDKNLSVELMQPDGSSAVMVMQMHFKGAGMQAASKMIDMDKTTISFTHFDPPLGSDYVHLMSQMVGGDAGAKAAAKAQVAKMCPQG